MSWLPGNVVCNLTPEEQTKRRGELRSAVAALKPESEALPDGMAYRVASSPAAFETVTGLLVLERDCCPWLSFEIGWPAKGPLTLRAQGPRGAPGARALLRDWLGPQSTPVESAPVSKVSWLRRAGGGALVGAVLSLICCVIEPALLYGLLAALGIAGLGVGEGVFTAALAGLGAMAGVAWWWWRRRRPVATKP